MRAFARESISALAASLQLVLTSICLFVGIGFSFCETTTTTCNQGSSRYDGRGGRIFSEHAYLQQLVTERSYRNNGARALLIGQIEDEMLTQFFTGPECAASPERVVAAVTRTLAANSLDLAKTISA